MNIEDIARIAHETNRAYCQSIGDDSQVPWAEAPDWQRQSAISGVQFHCENPSAGPSASHNSWWDEKKADGWVHGEVKSPQKKTHPCCVPYEQLPAEQRAKDYLFMAVVRSLKPFLTDTCDDPREQHPAIKGVLKYFVYGHLPQHLKEISEPFSQLAEQIAKRPESDGPETTVALRKLLESKDAAVRAAL